jgi:hypothetical protein
MEESSENETTCDVFMNEVRIEDEMLLEPKKMGSLQTKGNRNPKMNENNLKCYMHKEHFRKEIAKMHCVGNFIMLMITKKLL